MAVNGNGVVQTALRVVIVRFGLLFDRLGVEHFRRHVVVLRRQILE